MAFLDSIIERGDAAYGQEKGKSLYQALMSSWLMRSSLQFHFEQRDYDDD